MIDDDLLMGLEMTARAERKAGFNGYCKPPETVLYAIGRLVSAGFAQEHRHQPGWFRPTRAGADRVGHRIHAVQ